ncbi:hypothetical protein IFM89_036847 [Coptis chinensis]|uniref:PNO1 second type I KH domain-containing protein n=1 Tax=Coptis chinensis TaxID=261450 RepID=A0A835LWF8_9MAGN|nr:hypothetical protein IFM89_036847 [Coptis chinensis]
MRTQPDTLDKSDLRRCASFIKVIILGFSIAAARALLSRDNVYINSTSITGICVQQKSSKEENIQLMYKNIGKTKFAIEQCTKTSIFADKTNIYIMGSSSCIKNAKYYLRHLISIHFI